MTLSRINVNLFQPENEPVNGLVNIHPGSLVKKVGRKTGTTRGVVNDVIVQRWSNGEEPSEIVVLSEAQRPGQTKMIRNHCLLLRGIVPYTRQGL